MTEANAIQEVLCKYGITDKIASIIPLQEARSHEEIRLLYRIDLQDGLRLVCRISNEKHGSDLLLEQQSCFSEKLYVHGIPVAKKFNSFGNYCTHMSLDGVDCRFTLEEYRGEDVDHLNLLSFREFGKLLGKMHVVSEMDPTEMSRSAISRAIMENRANFNRILCHADTPIKALPVMKEIQECHDDLVMQLKDILSKLPHGAVHGDLSVFNNLVVMNGKLSVIDFNLAGDEAFLFDMLGSYFSSVHKYQWKDKMNSICFQDNFWEFVTGYCVQRKLHSVEKQYFPIAAALFDGLFYCKSLIEEYGITKQPEILYRFDEVFRHFDVCRYQWTDRM